VFDDESISWIIRVMGQLEWFEGEVSNGEFAICKGFEIELCKAVAVEMLLL